MPTSLVGPTSANEQRLTAGLGYLMTSSEQTSVRPDIDQAPEGVCEMCGHSDAAHDAIARRYCRASVTNAATRTCICSV